MLEDARLAVFAAFSRDKAEKINMVISSNIYISKASLVVGGLGGPRWTSEVSDRAPGILFLGLG